MDSSDPNARDRSRWRFDPNTGEPIGDNTPAPPPVAPVPSVQPVQPVQPVQAGQPAQPPPQDAFRVEPQGTPPQYTPPQNTQQYPPAPAAAPYPYGAQPPGQPPAQPAQQYGYPAYQQPPMQPVAPYGYPAQQVPAVAVAQPQTTVAVKRRSRVPLVIGIIVVLIAVLGVGGFFLYQTYLNPPAVSAEKLLPANTLGYFSFDPVLQGSQKAAMDKIGEAFNSQPGFKEALANIAKSFGDVTGSGSGDQSTPPPSLDTISSYLGNSVTVAILPPSTDDLNKLKDATNSGDIGSVGADVLGRNVVGIVDLDFNPLDKKGPISDLKQQVDNVGKAQLVEKYRDVDIHKFITNTTEIYFALLNGSSTAIVGMQAAPLHVVIDQYKDNKSLKDDATYKALSGQVPSDRIAALYLNLTEVYQQASLLAPDMTGSNGLQGANGSMLFTLSAANDGMQLDIASEADLNLMNTGVQVNPNAKPDPSTLNDIPANSLGFLVGTDLKTLLQASLDNLRKNPNGGTDIQQSLNDFQQQYGIDLEKDVIPLLDGDYALSMSAVSGQDGPDMTFVFQLKLKDGAKAASVLDKFASSDANKDNTQKVSVAGGTFYTSGDISTGGLIGVTQNRLMVVINSSGLDAAKAGLEETINNFGKGIGTTSDWNANKAHLPDGSNIIGYFDVKATRELVEKSMSDSDKQDYDANVKPLISAFKYVLLGSATQATKDGNLSRNHTVLFIGISK